MIDKSVEENFRKTGESLGLTDDQINDGLADINFRQTIESPKAMTAAEVYRETIAKIGSDKEVRTVSSTGAEKGMKEARHDLIPGPALDLLARLYGKGAAKYAAHNWRKGYEWSKSYSAAIRHLTLFWEGEDIDKEMGLPHVTCATFHLFALATYMTEHPEFDDRFSTTHGNVSVEESDIPEMTTADILEELASEYINQGHNDIAKTLLAVARDEKRGFIEETPVEASTSSGRINYRNGKISNELIDHTAETIVNSIKGTVIPFNDDFSWEDIAEVYRRANIIKENNARG